ncbi:MAG TPA: shikimate dehydrogenase [Streptosporangiaceae bacterium]
MRAAVLGKPIAHSLSPVLHRAAYAALGLDGWRYDAIECGEAGLPALLASCGTGWAGLSLTMPLKRAVLPLLGWTDPVALATGGANTVVFTDDEEPRGYNTDVAGLVTALTEAGVKPAAATILGAGATACSALAALRELGLTEVTVAVRDPSRAAGLLAAASRLGVRVRLAPFRSSDFKRKNPQTDLLISTVPEGGIDFFTEQLRHGHQAPTAIMDVVYNPWPTPLADAARRAGSAVISGYELLLHQAAWQVELMTGVAAPVPQMREAGLAELARRAG